MPAVCTLAPSDLERSCCGGAEGVDILLQPAGAPETPLRTRSALSVT